MFITPDFLYTKWIVSVSGLYWYYVLGRHNIPTLKKEECPNNCSQLSWWRGYLQRKKRKPQMKKNFMIEVLIQKSKLEKSELDA